MEHCKWMYKIAQMVVLSTFVSACGPSASNEDSLYKNIVLVEEAHLTDDSSSPYCDFSMDYSFLKEDDDSIAQIINRHIQREILGADYATLVPEAAIDSFKNTYLRDYRKEVGELYLADKAQAEEGTEIPAWYSQTYSLLTFLDEGHKGTMGVSANIFVDTGGAHPNQWGRWLNFDYVTGKLLGQEDVFQATAKADIEKILLDKLIRMQAEEHPEESVLTLEDLQELGFLQLTNMYIPDNFLLSKEEMLFLFNRYDIAPYSAGEIIIRVSYEEIGPYLKL